MKKIEKTVWCILNKDGLVVFASDAFISKDTFTEQYIRLYKSITNPSWDDLQEIGFRAVQAKLIIEIE